MSTVRFKTKTLNFGLGIFFGIAVFFQAISTITLSIGTLAVSGSAQAQSANADIAFDTEDMDFILKQIKFAERHAAGEDLANILPNLSVPWGLRTVTGEFNNLIPGQTDFGRADQPFPVIADMRVFPDAQDAGMFGPPGPTTYNSADNVTDSTPRIISNLIVNQSVNNPAAVSTAAAEEGENIGPDIAGADQFFIPNTAPDEGLSAPTNAFMTFFAQFFDHGLDLINKGGNNSTVFMPLDPSDPLFDDTPGAPNFMAMTRATRDPGPDGTLGTEDDTFLNATTPHVDQQQTYASDASSQILLRHYVVEGGVLQNSGLLLNGFGNDRILDNADDGGMATWDTIQAQAEQKFGIILDDMDGANVPMILSDLYGNFIPGPAGLPQLVTSIAGDGSITGSVEGNLANPVDATQALRVNHSFFIDVAHSAAPNANGPDVDTTGVDLEPGVPGIQSVNARIDTISGVTTRGIRANGAGGTYDDELLGLHFMCGDGRCNENIALTTVHSIFHHEHNRLADVAKRAVLDAGDLSRLNEWLDTPVGAVPNHGLPFAISNASLANQEAARSAIDALGLDWNGERIFQAARFGTEMQYNRIVFDEFSPTLAGLKDVFEGFHTNIDPNITAEFSQSVYRFGHSMLTNTVDRYDADFNTITDTHSGDASQLGLFEAFLNPLAFQNAGEDGLAVLSPEAAAGAVVRGITRTTANEIDEFVTGALQNQLVGLPLDLGAINIARGRDVGNPPLNAARAKFFEATQDTRLKPYLHWADYADNLRHEASLVNFIAAYGTHPLVAGADGTIGSGDAGEPGSFGDRRAAACAIVSAMASSPDTYCADNGFETSVVTTETVIITPAVTEEVTTTVTVIITPGTDPIPGALDVAVAPVVPDNFSVTNATTTVLQDVVFDATGLINLRASFNIEGTTSNGFGDVEPCGNINGAGNDDGDCWQLADNGVSLLADQSIPSVNIAGGQAFGPFALNSTDQAVTLTFTIDTSGTSEGADFTNITVIGDQIAVPGMPPVTEEVTTTETVIITPAVTETVIVTPAVTEEVTTTETVIITPAVTEEVTTTVTVIITPAVTEEVTTTVGVDVPPTPADAVDFLFSIGAWDGIATGLDNVDFWNGGLAEERMPFGGYLGSTHNFVFETQMEALQNGDRFYYVGRTATIHFFSELESNSFTSLVMRSTDMGEAGGGSLSLNVFAVPNHILEVDQSQQFDAAGDGTTADPEGDSELVPLVIRDADFLTTNIEIPDTTRVVQYTGGDHVTIGGTGGQDTIIGGIGDDSLYGSDGNDRIEGGDGADLIEGGAGDDIITDLSGPDVIEGGDGNDAIHSGNEEDVIFGDAGNDFIVNSSELGEIFAGLGDDYVFDGFHLGHIRGGAGDDWMENLGGGEDLFQGDNGAAPEAGEPAIKGNDVMISLGGNNDADMENGDDIVVDGPGIDRVEGQLGFDWVSFQNDDFGVDIDLDLTIFVRPILPPSNASVLNRYDRTEGISGSALNDILRGTDNEIGTGTGDELSADGLLLITGLSDLVPVDQRVALGLDVVTGEDLGIGWTGGEIILGGGGSDLMVGEGGNDIIDGDAQLTVGINTPNPAIRMVEGQALLEAKAAHTSAVSRAALDVAAVAAQADLAAAAAALTAAADAAVLAADAAIVAQEAALAGSSTMTITEAIGGLVTAAVTAGSIHDEWLSFLDACAAVLGIGPSTVDAQASAVLAAAEALAAEADVSVATLNDNVTASAALVGPALAAQNAAQAALDAVDEMIVVPSMQDIMEAVFAGVINPGELSISRVIENLDADGMDTTGGSDTAQFSGNLTDYIITVRGDGFTSVSDIRLLDGNDLVRNVERLSFADGITGPDGVPLVGADANGNTPATGSPAIAGAFVVGGTLTASAGTIADVDGFDPLGNISWIWQVVLDPDEGFVNLERDDGGDLIPAMGATLLLRPEDAGLAIRVVATFVDGAGVPESAISAPVGGGL